MREYIVLKYTKNSLVFDFKSLKEEERDEVNTGVFYEDSLFYTLRYFKKHINEIIKIFNSDEYDIDWFIVMRIVTFKYVVTIMNELELSKLRLLFNSSLSIQDYDTLLKIKTLKKVDCYFMPSFMKSRYEGEDVEVKLNNKNKLSDTFMLEEDALDYDVLYYKKHISIKKEYPLLLDDLEEFLRINYDLKAIDIYVYSKDIIKKIVELVKNDESKNVLVLLHQSHDKGNFINKNFAWLKVLNEECKDELTCEFRIVYSKDYIKNNLFKQLTFNNLKLMFILSIYVCATIFLVYKSYEYVEKLNTDKLKTDLMNDSLNNNEEYDALSGIDVDIEENITKEEIKSKYELENIMSSLVNINKDTIGYLDVKNTNIAYPVVQHTNNSYYLRRDFYKKSSSMGWIYLDYRNSKDKLDSNNIIYGHSMKNGTMFGTLKKVLSSSWRKDSNNMIISYDTQYGSYRFKIFSAYKVDYTTDYLKVNFESDIEFNDFIKLIKNRSVFKSNVIIDSKDVILTLSTCTGSSNQRLVVHAVLLEVGE